MAHILIIDDDESIRFLVQEELSLDGHRVSAADGGASGLQAVRDHTPDVVILDIKMPGMDGLEVLRRIKREHPQLPVLLFTAYSDYRDQAADCGAEGYLIKSADFSPMKAAVRRCLPPAA